MKVRDALKILAADGWFVARIRGSHRQLKHPVKKGTVTVAGNSGVEIPPGTLKSIWKQAQLEG
jgi:predicted RNA binding protein YcfA (HicA-like mRNA interferase family)